MSQQAQQAATELNRYQSQIEHFRNGFHAIQDKTAVP